MIYSRSPIANRVAAVGCLLVVFLYGCAGMREAGRSLSGISTREIEKSRQNSIKKVFKCDYFTCHSKIQEILKRIGAYVYAEDKKQDLIAIYVSRGNTTPAGLFFQEIDNTHTQIEIASPSSYARDLIAEKVFVNLESLLYQNEKKQ